MLSLQQVEHYHREGYVVYPGFLSGVELTAFHTEIEAITAGHTLAHHDKTRLEMEPKQVPDGTRNQRATAGPVHSSTRKRNYAGSTTNGINDVFARDFVANSKHA
jgi:hypothetical protein